MERQVARARWIRFVASGCLEAAAVLLVVAIPLNEQAVAYENGVTGDLGSYLSGLAALLAAVGGLFALHAALRPGVRGVAASLVFSVFAAGAAGFAGFINGGEPVFVNVGGACFAHADVWLAVYAKPTPGGCAGYRIPITEYALFQPAMYAAWMAGALCVAALVLLIIGRKRWRLVPLPPAARAA